MSEPTPPVDGPLLSDFKGEGRFDFSPVFQRTKPIMEALSGYAIEKGAEPSSLGHLAEVWEPGKWNIAKPNQLPPNTGGATNPWNGEVIIRPDKVDDLQIVLHESIHRAAVIARRRDGVAHPGFVVADIMGLVVNGSCEVIGVIGNDEFPKKTDIEKAKFLTRETKQLQKATELINEGVTEWATRKAKELKLIDGSAIDFPVVDVMYNFAVAMVDDIHATTNLTKDQIDALLMEVALTGDISRLSPALGGSFSFAELLKKKAGTRGFLDAISQGY